MLLFKAYNLIIESDFDLQLPKGEGKPDISLLKKEIVLPKLGLTKIHRRGIRAEAKLLNHTAFLHWKNIANFEADASQNLYYQRFIEDDGVFRLFALSEALGLKLFQKGYFLLHGSAVKIGQKALVFIGNPGAGKSTTIAAFAKAGFTVLSDDLVAISFDDEAKPVVLPAFPEIKLWEDTVENLGFDKSKLTPAFEGHNKYLLKQNESTFPQEAIPLAAIYVLQKPLARKEGILKPHEALVELLKNFPIPHQLLKNEFLQKHFSDSLKITSQIKVMALKRPKNFEALDAFISQF